MIKEEERGKENRDGRGKEREGSGWGGRERTFTPPSTSFLSPPSSLSIKTHPIWRHLRVNLAFFDLYAP